MFLTLPTVIHSESDNELGMAHKYFFNFYDFYDNYIKYKNKTCDVSVRLLMAGQH